MNVEGSNFPQKFLDPLNQALLAFGLIICILLGAKLVHLSGILEISSLFPWTTATAILLVFAVFNSVSSLAAPNMDKYWGRSILCFFGIAILAGLLAYWLSGISLGDAETYKWIYIVILFGYLVFLSIIRFMKTIVDFAQKEEWNQPKIRKRK